MSNPYPESVRPAEPTATTSNGPGRAALIVGLVLVAMSTTLQVLYIALPRIAVDSGGSMSDALQSLLPFNIVTVCLALAALVLGLIGVLLPRRPRGAAAAGLALGGVSVLGQLTSVLAGLALGG